MKTCIKCNIEKDDSDFRKGRNECKPCRKEYKKLWRENNPDKVKEGSKRYYENNQEKEMLKRARHRSKKKQIPFDLKEEDIIIPEICPALGISLKIGEEVMCSNSPTLDRIIPEKGYVKGNIIVMSNKANLIKQNATPEEIIAVGEYYKKLLEEAKKNE